MVEPFIEILKCVADGLVKPFLVSFMEILKGVSVVDFAELFSSIRSVLSNIISLCVIAVVVQQFPAVAEAINKILTKPQRH